MFSQRNAQPVTQPLNLTRRCFLPLLAPTLGLGLSGCANFISSSGPTRISVVHDAAFYLKDGKPDANLGYALVPVDASVATRLHTRSRPPMFGPMLTDVPAAEPTIGIGDTLQVEIFERHAGGLFIPQEAASRPGNFVQLQPEQVDERGHIVIPYAGTVAVAGRTPEQVAAIITQRLSSNALQPQVIVTVAQHVANSVSVLGDVNQALRFELLPGGERLLGALARAGGPKYADYASLVTVQRRGQAYTVRLSEIAHNPMQNIELMPGDVVYVAHEPRYFVAVGAIGQSTTLALLDRRFPFDDYELTLNEALAKAGGLEDDRANAHGVFLYREETRPTLEQLGLRVPANLPPKIPTIFMVNLANPAGFFYCNRIWMHNGDTIFVSNAPAVDLNKFINAVMPWTESAYYARNAAQ